jgi:hypothetical protein
MTMHFVAFLTQSAVAYPTGPLYLAMDNVKMYDAKVVRAWLALRAPRCGVARWWRLVLRRTAGEVYKNGKTQHVAV